MGSSSNADSRSRVHNGAGPRNGYTDLYLTPRLSTYLQVGITNTETLLPLPSLDTPSSFPSTLAIIMVRSSSRYRRYSYYDGQNKMGKDRVVGTVVAMGAFRRSHDFSYHIPIRCTQ